MQVSVIIPTFNYKHTIIAAIQSVILQTYPKELTEIIVVDDGSTDDTRGVLEEFIIGKTIKYFYQSNQGKASATISGINISTGKIIFCLDADDTFLPGKIQVTVDVFKMFPQVVHVSTPALIRYANQGSTIEKVPKFLLNKPTSGSEALNFFFSNNILFGGGSTFACLANILKEDTIPPEVNMYIDEFLVINALSKGDTYFISEPLSTWHIHEHNYSVYGSIDEHRINKNNSLLSSSKAILDYLLKEHTDKKIQLLYFLKHNIRVIHFAEISNKKSLYVIFTFIVNCFIRTQYPISVYIKYNAFNRLLPAPLIRILRKIKN
ncbi:MAG: glycosyltransferase family 2 protein [Sediminibacterium sp.]|nr:glycosyltransferase family 2 protein [Sediminibacterium sp.]